MSGLTRRTLLRRAVKLGGIALPGCLTACASRIVPVTHIVHVEREVTKVVTEIVRQTVIVEETAIVERTVEKVVTASPAPLARAVIVADLLDYGWTQFAMLMSPAFEEMFPNIVIRWRSLSAWSDYAANVATRQAAGIPSDLLEAPLGTSLARWHKDGITQPLDDLAQDVQLDTSTMLGGALSACRVADELAGIPFVAHGGDNLLLYHRGLFDRLIIEHPTSEWTLTTLASVARHLMADDPSARQGYGFRLEMPSALVMLRTFGACLLSADGDACALDSGAAKAYLDWLVDSHFGADPIAPKPWQAPRGLRELFLAGKLGMMRNSLQTIVQLERLSEGESFVGATICPTLRSGAEHAALPSGMAYAIGANSQVARETMQWLKYITSPEMGVQMFLAGYAEPGARKSSWSDERVLQRLPAAALAAQALDVAAPEPTARNYRDGECYTAWNRAIRELLAEHITVDECLARVCGEVDNILALPKAESLSE